MAYGPGSPRTGKLERCCAWPMVQDRPGQGSWRDVVHGLWSRIAQDREVGEMLCMAYAPGGAKDREVGEMLCMAYAPGSPKTGKLERCCAWPMLQDRPGQGSWRDVVHGLCSRRSQGPK